jgi:hypothetical protein
VKICQKVQKDQEAKGGFLKKPLEGGMCLDMQSASQKKQFAVGVVLFWQVFQGNVILRYKLWQKQKKGHQGFMGACYAVNAQGKF